MGRRETKLREGKEQWEIYIRLYSHPSLLTFQQKKTFHSFPPPHTALLKASACSFLRPESTFRSQQKNLSLSRGQLTQQLRLDHKLLF